MRCQRNFLLASAFAALVLSSWGEGATKHWLGTTSASAKVDSNWAEGAAPTIGDKVVLDENSGSNPMTWDIADVQLSGWEQTSSYAGTVTLMVGTSRSTAGSIAADGINRELKINGDFFIDGGTVTCGSNANISKAGSDSYEGDYRLWVTATGSVRIGADASLDVSNCGYPKRGGPGFASNQSSHGGRQQDAFSPGANCYGNLFEPGEIGCGSPYTLGAGSVKIVAGSTLTVNGKITATALSSSYYPSCGGSVWLIASRFAGTGSVTANVGSGGENRTGGGRIALYLTDPAASFDGEMFSVTCYGASMPGTIYRQLATDARHGGELIIKCSKNATPTRGVNTSYLATTYSTELYPVGDEAEFKFRKISLSGGAVLGVCRGATLNLENTVISAGTGSGDDVIAIMDGTLKLPAAGFDFSNVQLWSIGPVTIDAADGVNSVVTLRKGGRFDSPIAFPGSLVLASGTIIHTPEPKDSGLLAFCVDITTGKDLMLMNGASINADKAGYDSAGPGRSAVSSSGCSHGGRGYLAGDDAVVYGDPLNPLQCGTGMGSGQYGGGLIKLDVAGRLTVNGAMSTASGYSASGQGSAGSINIKCGTIEGAITGSISASSPELPYNVFPGGGGGRISIMVRDAEADFSSLLGAVTAFGGRQGKVGGAGTICYRKGLAPQDTILVIDNGGRGGAQGGDAATEFQDEHDGLTVGSIQLRRNARVRVRKGVTVNVISNFENDNTATVVCEGGEGSTLGGTFAFVDKNVESRIIGNNSFTRFLCEVPGKTLRFGDSNSAVSIVGGGVLEVNGTEAEKVYLRGLTADMVWNLRLLEGSSTSMQYVDVADSDATGSVIHPIARDSKDSGNNIGWTFVTVKVGETNKWTGAVSELWSEGGNWSLGRKPYSTDVVIIENEGMSPQLDAVTEVYQLRIESGARLALNGRALVVSNDCRVAGALVCSASEPITLLGDVDFSAGMLTPASSTVTVAGEGDRTVTLDQTAFHNLTFAMSSGTVFFQGSATMNSVSMRPMDAGSFTVSFSAASSLSSGEVFLDGVVANDPRLHLNGPVGATWILKASRRTSVNAVEVSGCDSRGGSTFWAYGGSVDSSGNLNWRFDGVRAAWTGNGGDAFYTNALNWSSEKVPDAMTTLEFAENINREIIVDGLAEVARISATAGTVRFYGEGSLTVAETVDIGDAGTVTLDVPMTVNRALSLRDGGKITHSPNGATQEHTLRLMVLGDATIEKGGAIDVIGKGYWGKSGPGASGYCGSHGGWGSSAFGSSSTYGSIFKPVESGSGGFSGSGGGVIRLSVGGLLTVDGTIAADGQTVENYAGAGGSVWIDAHSIAGSKTGVISAKGGVYTQNVGCGGGGRVAVYLTGDVSDFNQYLGVVSSTAWAGCGSVYLETKAEGAGCGRIVLDNGNAKLPMSTDVDCTSVPALREGFVEGSVDMVKDFRDVRIVLSHAEQVCLAENLTVHDVIGDSSYTRINLNDHVLRIQSIEHRPRERTVRDSEIVGVVSVVRGSGGKGRIEWPQKGLTVFVR